MVVTPAGIVIEVSALAPSNALFPMEFSWLPGEKVTVASLLASLNVPSPMVVTPAGMVMAVNEVALWNAEFPMLVTLEGRFMEVSEDAPWNAEAPILVTPDGTTTAPTQPLPDETTPLVIV